VSKGHIIALDAMGGDQAPEMVIEGLEIAHERFPGIHFLLFGDSKRLEALLDETPALHKSCSVHHTDDVVSAEAKPSQALRGGRESSMRIAINSVRDGLAEGVVSAGNTGALMAIAKFVLKTLPGIDRPAIASFFPTQKGETLMLDLGANVECDSDNLVQFAVMGEVFVRTVLGLDKPSIGLLNVGSEQRKGHDSVRRASDILSNSHLPIQFHGFVEGDDIAAGTVDVIVTDGFSGNIALKTAEGIVHLYTNYLKRAYRATLVSKLGYLLSRGALQRLKSRLDPRVYNGAMLLGLNGIVVKSHGGTDAVGFANAIGVAVDMINNGFNDIIKEEFRTLNLEPDQDSDGLVL